jgi:chemotaxis protein MotA
MRIHNPFLRSGVQLVIDGTPTDKVLELLEWRIARLKARERAEAQLFRTMATYAPAFGMLGTLIGLINMLHGMGTASMAVIGQGMAVALITTFYGLILANLVFKPIAVKLERRTERRVLVMNMVLEGIVMLSERRSPSFVRETLSSFLTHHEDELHAPPGSAVVTTEVGA